MKIKLSGRMNLEQFSERIQIAVAQLEEMGVKQIERCNVYFTPVDPKGDEVHVWGNNKKPIKEMEIKPEVSENPDKMTILKKDK